MAEQHIQPHKVTKPIQLLAAWLVGLIFTNLIFLTSAIQLDKGGWERSALVVSAIINVPLFLFALFLLQTRFRAELQEDTFYSEYLSKKTATVVRIDKSSSLETRVDELERMLFKLSVQSSVLNTEHSEQGEHEIDWSNWPIALNDLHPKFDEIRKALKAASIPLSSIFGSPRGALPPVKWIIALSNRMPVTHKAKLLNVLLPFGFDGFELWEPFRDAGENEDAYIGSYGIDTYARISPELNDLIQTNVDAADLEYYYDKYKFPAIEKAS